MSVVVPCRNEAVGIQACLLSILNQDMPEGGFEVIVADGMSDDGTREVLQRLAATYPRLRVIDNPRRFTPSGMNAGIRASQGRYIAIMGAHNRYAPDYLRQCIMALNETGADDVGGAVFADARTYVQRAVAASHHSPFSVGGSRWHDTTYEGPADSVWGGCYRREVFDRIGFFDEDLVRNQDDELNLRLLRAGGRIWQTPRIRSWYTPRSSLRALLTQYRQYGYWKVRVIRKHGSPASARHLVPATFVAVVLVSGSVAATSLVIPSSATARAGRLVFGLSLASYAVLDVAASLITARSHGFDLTPLLPMVFATYHVGYGVGFLEGLIDYATSTAREPRGVMTAITRQ